MSTRKMTNYEVLKKFYMPTLEKIAYRIRSMHGGCKYCIPGPRCPALIGVSPDVSLEVCTEGIKRWLLSERDMTKLGAVIHREHCYGGWLKRRDAK